MSTKADELHAAIMNIRPRRLSFALYADPDLARECYMEGHRDARHAAAELVAASSASRDAEVQRLRAPSAEAEFCIEGAGGMFLASTEGPRAEAWREIQHYAAQYADEGPLTIYEVTRRPVTDGGLPTKEQP